MKNRNFLYSILAVAFLALTALFFFFPDDVQGNVLQQHDIMQGLANGQEGKAYHEATGETTRWTDSLFGGMPNFQIAPSYPANDLLTWIGKVYMLGLPSPANLLFGMMVGFFIMCLCLKMKWQTSLFAALAWGFSSYFIIIIGAGHIWKFLTLCYIPPTIGGLALLYRGRWLPGLALTSLFGALQLQSNHPQMSYYFLAVIFCLVCAWLWIAIKEGKLGRWTAATGLAILAGALAVGANSASLYNSLEYSKETVRGRATELKGAGSGAATGGMDRDAITAWSYSPSETFSLLIPNVKGGATIKPVQGSNQLLPTSDTRGAQKKQLSAQEQQFVSQFPQYFGDQPMTNGPVYVGSFVLLLAILGMFTLKGRVETPVKWALFVSIIVSLILSWGHNLPGPTNFMIDHFPGYNKFRAVASILVIVEFCIPLLAAMTLRQMALEKDYFSKYRTTVWAVFGLGAAVCFLGWVAPGIFGSPFSIQETEMLQANGILGDPAYANVIQAIRDGRLSLVSDDSLRSLLYIAGCSAILYMWGAKKTDKPTVWILCIAALALIDMYGVGKRYVDSDSFVEAQGDEISFEPTAADLRILEDKSNYRVMDIDGFSEARSSYFHHTIGGYHAAKLTRYNDLLQKQILANNTEVLNMLNAKYFIHQGEVMVNPEANGNAWFVSRMDYVAGPDAEMAALDTIPTKSVAVADRKFESVLGQATAPAPGDTIYESSYAPNRLTYRYRNAKGGVAVFSEIYFPWGWEATVNGKAAPIGRADYVLRALRLPAGEGEVVMTFDPQSLKTTNAISMVSVIIIYLFCILALIAVVMFIRRDKIKAKE